MRSQSFYKGGFLNGRFCGEGFYQGVLGERYQGQWFNNQMNGFGSYSWTGGVQFRGEFCKGKMLRGVLFQSDGTQVKIAN